MIPSLISSLLLVLAYYAPSSFCCFIFIFLIPLFYSAFTTSKLRSLYWFGAGIVWGSCFFSLHWITFIPLFFNHTYGWARLLLYPLLILYVSLWTGVWFFCCAIGSKRSIAISWTIGTFLYFYLLNHYALLPFGCFAGYPLANPIVLLTYNPQWCTFLYSMNREGLLLLLILFQIICTYILATKRPELVLLVSLFIIPFIYGWGVPLKQRDLKIVKDIHPLFFPKLAHAPYIDVAQELAYSIINAAIKYPDSKVLVLPESAFPFYLNKHLEIIDMWSDSLLGERALIVGSQYLDAQNRCFNTVYVILAGRIIQTYRKKTRMPFFEYLPSIFNHSSLLKIFFHNKNQFFAGEDNQNELLSLNPTQNRCALAVCSEFFLQSFKYTSSKYPLVVLVNDSWFLRYFQELLLLYARLHAYEYQMPLLYVSFSHGEWIFPYYCH